MLFGPVVSPGGGMKIILEYANRLAQEGYKVNIVYPATLNWKSRNLKYKLKSIYHYFYHELTGWKCRRWFKLDPRVREIHAISLNFHHIPKSDIYIATEARTAPYVAKYPVANSDKFYFIQDYENWYFNDHDLRETYHLPLNKIVIADWLADVIRKEEGECCKIVKNSFDFNYFVKSKDISERDKFIVGTLYHTHPRKDFKTAFSALNIVHEKYPQLKVLIFGTDERPSDLPEWYEYWQKPNRKDHNYIYNNASIFIGSSKVEGWGLTVGEAMICGAAIACTDNKGYKEMAINEENALLSPVGDSDSLAKNIIKLIENDSLRIQLASNACRFIQQFTWEIGYKNFKAALNL